MSSNVSTRYLQHRARLARNRHQRRRTTVLAAIATAAACAGAWWVATGPILAVHQVTIVGYTHSDQADVVRRIQIGAVTGDALHLPVQRIRAAVAASPWVENISVRHDWPRGVRVKVTQARPAAIAVVAGERWLVSTQGRVLERDLGRANDLPQMELTREITAGEWLRGADGMSAVRLSVALSPDVRGRVRGLHIAPSGTLVGTLTTGNVELRFGRPTDLWRKGRALDAVLANATTKATLAKALYVDFSNADAPVFGGLGDSVRAASTQGQDSATLNGQASTIG